jgi:enterochelin esterase family protein
MARTSRGPIVETTDDPEAYDVTFVFADRRRSVNEVGLLCPAVPDGFARLVPLGQGTFARTFSLPSGVRVKYHFCLDPPARLDDDALTMLARSPVTRRIDYFNPNLEQVRIRGLRLRILESLLSLPGAPAPPPLPPPPHAQRGEVEELSFDSTALGHRKDVLLYRPPGYTPEAGPYPTVLLLETNEEWRGAEIFDGLIATGRIPPFVGVLIGGGRHFTARLRDLNGGPALTRFVVDELLPALSSRCATRDEDITAAGFSAGALAAAALCADEPSRFSRLIAISGALHLTPRMDVLHVDAGPSHLLERYERTAHLPRYAYLAAGTYEDTPRQQICSQTAALAHVLDRRGCTVRLDVGLTDHDALSARAYLAAGLHWMFGHR